MTKVIIKVIIAPPGGVWVGGGWGGRGQGGLTLKLT